MWNDKKKIIIILLIVAFFTLFLTGGVLFVMLTGCKFNGGFYLNGSGYNSEDGCNICSCSMGKTVCTLMACENDSTGISEDETDYSEQDSDIDDTSSENQEESIPQYNTYEDSYIKFEYPSDWAITVNSDNNNDGYEGIRYITFENSSDDLQIRFSNQAGSGGDGYYYIPSTNKFYDIYADPSSAETLSYTPEAKPYTSTPLKLYWFSHINKALGGAPISNDKIYVGLSTISCNNEDCSDFSFLRRKDTAQGCYTINDCTNINSNMILVYIQYDASNLEEFNQNADKLQHFFDTVEAKDF